MTASSDRKSKNKSAISVFDFVDFRSYLRSYYLSEKTRRPAFSHRLFSRLAGLRSPNFLKLVMDGERNLGEESVPKFAKALGLDAEESAFFFDLVTFTQAVGTTEKTRAFERIASSRRFRMAKRIDGELFTYLSHWSYPAIRELCARHDFQEDPRWIAAALRPRISSAEAQSAMRLLFSLGLVVRDPETGRVGRGEPTLTTEHEVRSLAAANFHRQMLERAAAAIDEVPREERDLAALTVCISPATAALVKERIHKFREELTQLCDADTQGRVVYQFNVQWFPLSVCPREETE
jgi:uncharacterized protein (TIGR02147 family)